jgi:hypothetical protein
LVTALHRRADYIIFIVCGCCHCCIDESATKVSPKNPARGGSPYGVLGGFLQLQLSRRNPGAAFWSRPKRNRLSRCSLLICDRWRSPCLHAPSRTSRRMGLRWVSCPAASRGNLTDRIFDPPYAALHGEVVDWIRLPTGRHLTWPIPLLLSHAVSIAFFSSPQRCEPRSPARAFPERESKVISPSGTTRSKAVWMPLLAQCFLASDQRSFAH